MILNRLNEKNEVKRALFGDYRHKIKTFAIMTAENPMGKHLTPEENNKRTEQLLTLLKKLHIQFVPIQGMFEIEENPNDRKNYGDTRYGKKANGAKRPEHSFILINPSFDEVAGLSTKFEQLSFFFGENMWSAGVSSDSDVTDNDVENVDRHTSSVIGYYETRKVGDPYKLIEKTRKIDSAEDFDNFFSRHGSFKYSIYLKLFNESYDDINEILDYPMLDEALADARTTKHRARSRVFAYNGKLI